MTYNSEYSTNTIDKKEKSKKANDQIKEFLLNRINEFESNKGRLQTSKRRYK